MKIYIDADGCPVVDETIALAKEFDIPCFIICDTSHRFERQGAKTITVDKGADSADFYLVNLVSKGDVTVTQDYGLAAMCLSKRAIVLDQNGRQYTNENISGLLEMRDAAKKARRAGAHLKGPKKRTAEQDEMFIDSLRRILTAETAGEIVPRVSLL